MSAYPSSACGTLYSCSGSIRDVAVGVRFGTQRLNDEAKLRFVTPTAVGGIPASTSGGAHASSSFSLPAVSESAAVGSSASGVETAAAAPQQQPFLLLLSSRCSFAHPELPDPQLIAGHNATLTSRSTNLCRICNLQFDDMESVLLTILSSGKISRSVWPASNFHFLKNTRQQKKRGAQFRLPGSRLSWLALEHQLQTELDVPAFVGSSASLSGRATLFGLDEISALRICDDRCGIQIVDVHVLVVVIEDIVELTAELQTEPLGQLEGLVEVHVPIPEPR
jgi:hypothetical protein